MFDYLSTLRKRDEIADRYDRLNAALWLGQQLSDRLSADLAPVLGPSRDPFRDYCDGRISRRYFLSLHPLALHLVILRRDARRLVSEIRSRETETGVVDDYDRTVLQYARRDVTNRTIASYPSLPALAAAH